VSFIATRRFYEKALPLIQGCSPGRQRMVTMALEAWGSFALFGSLENQMQKEDFFFLTDKYFFN
jgi:hypothetical protein